MRNIAENRLCALFFFILSKMPTTIRFYFVLVAISNLLNAARGTGKPRVNEKRFPAYRKSLKIHLEQTENRKKRRGTNPSVTSLMPLHKVPIQQRITTVYRRREHKTIHPARVPGRRRPAQPPSPSKRGEEEGAEGHQTATLPIAAELAAAVPM